MTNNCELEGKFPRNS
uniref:Uncharacterized protein n=1 Tax=Rhizophora mucronata TaxID=61149 RepID=A0A2P2PXS6_RHIMU